MNKTEPNQSAFACVDGTSHLQEGLTKREYFASMAMQGILSKESHAERLVDELDSVYALRKRIIDASVIMADELIKALNEGGDNE